MDPKIPRVASFFSGRPQTRFGKELELSNSNVCPANGAMELVFIYLNILDALSRPVATLSKTLNVFEGSKTLS